jgi:hypothetical protein
MRTSRHLPIVSLIALSFCAGAGAAPGDVFVPAHRTRDGHYVPPNVPPLSGGTHLARRPSRGAAPHRAAKVKRSVPAQMASPPASRRPASPP